MGRILYNISSVYNLPLYGRYFVLVIIQALYK
ncbi:hypothetical protein SAMN05216597_3706 [Pseudomonas cannabina]|nr:hypothetical protein SAMN05216597_3706 [Pseudomonas cannabina]